MPRLYSGRRVIKTLVKAGFYQISQKGSHVKLRGFWRGKLQTVIVPLHKEIAHGTFQSVLKQAEMSQGEFESFVK